MEQITLKRADVGFIAVTRVVLGVGVGLLIAGGLGREARKTLGFALLGVGAVTTVPILMKVLGKQCEAGRSITLVA
jgi:hypothetical protein